MRALVVKIGNSRGIRIPKPILEQTGIQKEVEMDLGDNCIVLRSVERPRKNWEQAFLSMAEHGDDQFLDGDLVDQNSWDESEWEW